MVDQPHLPGDIRSPMTAQPRHVSLSQWRKVQNLQRATQRTVLTAVLGRWGQCLSGRHRREQNCYIIVPGWQPVKLLQFWHDAICTAATMACPTTVLHKLYHKGDRVEVLLRYLCTGSGLCGQRLSHRNTFSLLICQFLESKVYRLRS